MGLFYLSIISQRLRIIKGQGEHNFAERGVAAWGVKLWAFAVFFFLGEDFGITVDDFFPTTEVA